MTPELLSTILLVLFIIVLLVAVIAGLIGLLKGIYKTTLKTIIKAGLVTGLVFLSPSISNWIGTIRFPNPANTSEKISILSYLVDFLNKNLAISPMNGMSVYETTILLANSLLSFVVFLLGMILIQIFISLITCIFYHGIFRWFLPVETKSERRAKKEAKKVTKIKVKKHNPEVSNVDILTSGLLDKNGKAKKSKREGGLPLLRIPGAIVGACQEFVFVLVLLTPITGLARIAISNRDNVSSALVATGVDDSTVTQIDGYMDVVENSILYKLLGTAGFDLKVMNKASSVTLNNTSVNLSGLINSAFDVAEHLLKEGIISYDQAASQVTINLSMLLSVETVDSLISTVISSPMIMALIPPLVDVALNSMSNNNLAIDELDFSDVDWTNELSIVKDIYAEIYTSAIAPMVSDSGFNVNNFLLKTSTMTDEEMDKLVSALENLGKMESVKKNLPVILSGFGALFESQGIEIFPTDINAYKNIDWSHDLKVFGHIALEFFKTINSDISASVNFNVIRDETFKCFKDADKRKKVSELIVGSSTSEGLLDINLFSILSLGDIVSSTLATIPSIEKYVKGVDIATTINSLNEEELKSEFKTMFDVAGTVFSENSAIDMDNLSNIDIFDTKVNEQLVTILNEIDRSEIFTKLYPSIMKSVLFNTTGNLSTYLYGLTAYNFNFNAEDFISDFRSILSLLPQVKDLQEVMTDSSKTNKDKLVYIADNSDILKELLQIVTGSDFFNAKQQTGISSTEMKNVNIHTLLTNLFKEEPFNSMKLVAPSLEDMQKFSWESTGTELGEIDRLLNVVKDASKNADFLTGGDCSLNKIENINGLKNLLKDGLDSKMLRPSILSIIDSSVGDYLSKLGIPLSLNEMRTEMWKEDIDAIGDLLAELKELDNLENIDFTKLNKNKLNKILTILSKTNFIKVSNDFEDPFGYAIYSLLKKQGFFADMGISNPDVDDFNCGEGNWSTSLVKDKDNKDIPNLTATGEIAYLTNVIGAVKDIGFDSFKNGKIPEGFINTIKDNFQSHLIRGIFTTFLSETASNVVLGEGFEKVIPSIDFSVLKSLTKEEFVYELETFEFLYKISSEKVGNTGKTQIEYILNNFFNLGEDSLATFSELIDKVSHSKLFTTTKAGESLAPIARLVSASITQMNLKKKVTLDSNNYEVVFNGMLHDIPADNWDAEGLLFQQFVEEMQGLDPGFLDLVGNKIGLVKAQSLFNIMNKSSLLHRLPISILREGLDDKGFNQMLKDPDTGKTPHPINYLVHLTTSQEDIDFWQNEYNHALKMTLGDGGLAEIFSDENTNLKDLKFSDLQVSFLYNLGSMKIFEENRSYLLVHLISNYKTETFDPLTIFKDATTAPYGENLKAMRLEELFFKNPKLLDANGNLDEAKTKIDLNLLSAALDKAIKAAKTIGETTSDFSSVTLDFVELNNYCYTLLEGGTFYRSDLTSEVVAGVETKMINNPSFSSVLGGLAGVDFYANNYALINTIEGRGLNGLKELAKSLESLSASKPYFTKAELEPIFKLLGSTSADCGLIDTELKVFKHFDALSDYSTIHNSKLTVMLDTYILSVPVLKTGDLLPSRISSLTTLNGTNTTYYSLLESLNIA